MTTIYFIQGLLIFLSIQSEYFLPALLATGYSNISPKNGRINQGKSGFITSDLKVLESDSYTKWTSRIIDLKIEFEFSEDD